MLMECMLIFDLINEKKKTINRFKLVHFGTYTQIMICFNYYSKIYYFIDQFYLLLK
jgi:hypothetical protein